MPLCKTWRSMTRRWALFNTSRDINKKELTPVLLLVSLAKDACLERKVFGTEGEEKFMALREIFFTEGERLGWLPVQEGKRQTTKQGDDQVKKEEEEGNNEEEEESQQVDTYVTDKEVYFKNFVL